MISLRAHAGLSPSLFVLRDSAGSRGRTRLDFRRPSSPHQARRAPRPGTCFYQPLGVPAVPHRRLRRDQPPPFDFAEAEPELVGGYHTEYSSMRFAPVLPRRVRGHGASPALSSALFLGGWPVPCLSEEPARPSARCGVRWPSMLKVGVLPVPVPLVRWTLPRFRYDQLMDLCWKVMLPLALAEHVRDRRRDRSRSGSEDA